MLACTQGPHGSAMPEMAWSGCVTDQGNKQGDSKRGARIKQSWVGSKGLEEGRGDTVLTDQLPKGPAIFLCRLCCFGNIPLIGPQQFSDVHLLELGNNP